MKSGSLTIGQLAARAGVTRDTLRYYERAGLLPTPQHPGTGALPKPLVACRAIVRL